MNTYRNARTGVVITVESEIRGEDWEKITAPKKGTKKAGDKNDIRNDK